MIVCFLFRTKCRSIWPPILFSYDWIVSPLSENNENVEVAGKRVNLGDGEGLQIPCTLLFIGETKYINIERYFIVINIKIKNINFPSFLYRFVVMNAWKFELASVICPVDRRNRSN